MWELRKKAEFSGVGGPVLTAVMDGVGVGRADGGDAVSLARTPNLDWLRTNGLHSQLLAHGRAVGLPTDDDMGNSEVGHNALGAGRIFDQGALRVQRAIQTGDLFASSKWRSLLEHVGEKRSTLHFLGLLSDGNVHSHQDHLFAMLRAAAAAQMKRVRVHILLDGRDVEQVSALKYVDALEDVLAELNAGSSSRDFRIASGGGRMKLTMDRYEADWAMVEEGWKHHVRGDGDGFASAREAIQALRTRDPDVVDQNLPGFVVKAEGEAVGRIVDGDGVVLFNFRGDRAVEISRAFDEESFDAFRRGPRPDVRFLGMMEYDGDAKVPAHYLVDPPEIEATASEYLVHNGVSLFACSETQKFGHVTFFWNGNRSGRFSEDLETYVEIPSGRLPFEERPWMKAAEITDATLAALSSFRCGRINYANGDMVGHTGDLEAAVLAVEAVDLCIGRLIPAVREAKGALIVTADHGNADEMYLWDKSNKDFRRDEDGQPKAKTSHTLNPVPFYLYAPGVNLKLRSLEDPAFGARPPGLANVAASVFELLGFEAPSDYEPSLLDL